MSKIASFILDTIDENNSNLEQIIRRRKSPKRIVKNSLDVLRVGVYRRVSTREQAEDGQSLFAQQNKINNYLNFDTSFSNKKIQLIDFVDEGKSAKNIKREGLRQLIQSVKTNQLDFIVVVKLDRLTRRLTDLQYLTDLFQKYNVNLVSINEKLDTETATGRFFITILGSLAQLEREQISERVQDVFENIAPKQPLGGYAPFGYFYLPEEKQHYPYLPEYCKKFNIPPLYLSYTDEVFYPGDYIPEIYNWYQTHESFNVVAKKLTESYIPTPLQIQRSLNDYLRNDLPNNIEVSRIFISTPKKWSRQTVKNVLSNPFYAGVRVWNKFQNRLKTTRSPDKWILVHDAHEKLISPNLYRRTHELMNSI